jgi:hypothetical protein
MGNTPLTRIKQSFRGHYGYVLGSLLVILTIYPFVGEEGWLGWLLDLSFVVVILSCFLVSLGQRIWGVVLILAIAGEIIATLARVSGIEFFQSPGRVLRVVVLIAAMVVVLRDVLRAKRVTMDTVFAACSVYLLMALVWSSLYIAIEVLAPGSFKLGPTEGPGSMGTASQLVYFSMITLTTVGYGDITPNTPQASMLAALEGLIGQLFIAIILARLVALELTGRRKQSGDEEL